MKRESLYLVLLYCLAHVPLAVTTGQFHDGFCFEHGDARLTEAILWADGRPIYGYFINYVTGFHSHLVPRLFTFFAYLAAAFLMRNVLRTMSDVTADERFFIVAFAMLFPADSTRVSLPWGYYALSYLLFFVGFWLVSLYMARRKMWIRVAALVVFFVSFGLPLLLVFYGLVIAYIAYRRRDRLRSLKSTLGLAWDFIDFLILPFIFWIIREMAFPPTGSYSEYFRLGFSHLGLIGWASAIRGAVIRPLMYLCLACHMVAACCGRGRQHRSLPEAENRYRWILRGWSEEGRAFLCCWFCHSAAFLLSLSGGE